MRQATSSQDHRQKAASQGPVSIALVTVSDTRTEETDANGKYLREQIEQSGNHVTAYRLIKDEPGDVNAALEEMCAGQAQIIIFNGGTGISRRDQTFDVIARKLEKTITGFGEIFRMLSYQEVGAAAMLSRAVAGVYRGKVIIAAPGSPNAVVVAWKKLIAPELEHLAWELTR